MSGRWTILVCGEPSRADDGAAFAAAERLDGLPAGTRVRPIGQLDAGELLEASRRGPCVVLDAVRGLAPGTTMQVPLLELAAAEVATSSHAMPLSSSVALAAALGADLEASRFVGIGGREFGLGHDLSPEVSNGLDEVARTIRGIVGARGDRRCA